MIPEGGGGVKQIKEVRAIFMNRFITSGPTKPKHAAPRIPNNEYLCPQGSILIVWTPASAGVQTMSIEPCLPPDLFGPPAEGPNKSRAGGQTNQERGAKQIRPRGAKQISADLFEVF